MEFDDKNIQVQGSVVDFSRSDSSSTPSDYQKLMQLSAAEVVSVSDLTEIGKRSDAFQYFSVEKGIKNNGLLLPILLGLGGAAALLALTRRTK